MFMIGVSWVKLKKRGNIEIKFQQISYCNEVQGEGHHTIVYKSCPTYYWISSNILHGNWSLKYGKSVVSNTNKIGWIKGESCHTKYWTQHF